MKRRAIEKAIQEAAKVVNREIAAKSKGGKYSAGLASEGYAGGYRDALDDVQLLLNNVPPDRRGYWEFLKQTTP